MEEGGEGQPFEEIAKQFSSRREDTTPNAPFLDEKSVFEEEAPSTAQRRLALDFYNGLSTLVERQQGRYPTPLDIVEFHQLHLEAIRNTVPQGEIVPEYTLMHVTGAGNRLLAYTYASEQYTNEAAFTGLKNRQVKLNVNLEEAAHLEAIDYPLVLQRDAIGIQQSLWQEAQAFLAMSRPDYVSFLTLEKITPASYPFLQFFPEEHPTEVIRKMALGAVWHVESDLRRVRERTHHLEQFGIREALASVTNFGHDDIDKYSLVNVLGAAKRNVLWHDVRRQWGDSARDAVSTHKLLTQAVANRPQA